MKRLVFLSLEFWDDIWRRNQFICRELIHRHPDLEILWLNPPLDVSLFSKDGAAWLSGNYRVHHLLNMERMQVFQPFKLFPNIIAEPVNQLLFKRALRAVLSRMGWSDFYIWINNQSLWMLATVGGARCLIYDITDDWTEASLTSWQRQRVMRDDSWLCEHADAVIVCSEQLQAQKNSSKAPVHLIPNGVDYVLFAPDKLSIMGMPPELAAVKHPIVGYTGTLHEDRFDVDLVAQVMEKLSGVQFLFVGPNYLTEANRRRMLAYSNCLICGPKPYEALPSYVGAMDVLITPHKVNKFTDSLDPLKLYEYMATGKPVVSTACGRFRDLSGMIEIATSADEFAAKLAGAIQHPEINSDRIAWASQFAWDRRAAEIESVLGW